MYIQDLACTVDDLWLSFDLGVEGKLGAPECTFCIFLSVAASITATGNKPRAPSQLVPRCIHLMDPCACVPCGFGPSQVCIYIKYSEPEHLRRLCPISPNSATCDQLQLHRLRCGAER